MIEDKDLKTLANFSPLHSNTERENLKHKLGQKIMLGAAKYIPGLEYAAVKEVGVGFVKMFSHTENGNGYLYAADSAIHQRREQGIQVRDLCYISFSGIKMTYTFKTAQSVVEILKQQICLQNKLGIYLNSVINHDSFDQDRTYRLRSALLRSLTEFTLSQMKKDGILNTELKVAEETMTTWFTNQSEKLLFIVEQYQQQIQKHANWFGIA